MTGIGAVADQRDQIVALAREWLGTPYRHGARLKAVGCDCTFLAEVYTAAGIMPAVDIAPYPPSAHLNRTSGVYLATVMRYATETDTPMPGDVVLYLIGRDWSHGGIIVDWPMIIHADLGARATVLARGDAGELTRAKARKFFTFVKDAT